MNHLVDLHQRAQRAQKRATDEAARFHAAVAAALERGVPATTIAAALGVSRGRVYQWRDKAR